MSRSFSAAVVVYVLFIIVLDHGYLEKEKPLAGVDLSVIMARLGRGLAAHASFCLLTPTAQAPLNVSWQRLYPNATANQTYFDLSVPGPNNTASVLQDPRFKKYCTTGATDYIWDVNLTRTYVNNTCVPYYSSGELIEQGYQNVWLYTYFRQQSFSRNCTDAGAVPKYYMMDPPDYPYAPDYVKFPDHNDPGFVPNCGFAKSLLNTSVLTMDPERAELTLVATYSTSWGRTRSSFATSIEALDGVASPLPGTKVPLLFAANEQITVSFSELLAIAGVDLDTPNVLDDGGLGPPWPTYRLTGVRIDAELKFGNFVDFPNSTKLDPFNFADYLVIRLYPSSMGAFAGPGPKTYYTGHLFDLNKMQQTWLNNESVNGRDQYPWPESLFTVRTPQGVQIQFHAAGLVGRFSGTVLLGALVGAIIMTSVAEKLTDMSAAFFINGFRAQKFMEDNEFRIRMMLRAQLLDSPSPEQVSMFEAEIVEMYGNRMYKAVLKRKRERVAEAHKSKKKVDLLAVDEQLAKELAIEAAADAAAAAAAVEDEEEDRPYVPTGGRQRSAPGGSRPSRRPGGLASTTPTVTKLLIAGEPFVSSVLRAQGYLESCRCVRFQWYSSSGGRSFEPIPFAMMPTFLACADDVGCLIAVDAVPVTDDGFEGAPRRTRVGPLRLRVDTSARVAELLELAHAERGCSVSKGMHGFRSVTHLDEQSGFTLDVRLHIGSFSVSMHVSTEPVSEKSVKQEWRPAGSLSTRGVACRLDRQDERLLQITAPFGGASAPQLDLLFEDPADRDLVALVLREMAKDGGDVEAAAGDDEDDLAPTDDE